MAGQAAEQRTIVAHGVSRGFGLADAFSPGRGERGVGVGFLPPLPGLEPLADINPRLTPWATFCRASGAPVARRQRLA